MKALLIAISIFSFNVFAAEVQPVAEKGRVAEIADTAANIFWVKNVKIGKYAYKVVSMDSELNGDVSATVFVVVGEGGVGGGAGYEKAFQISPSEQMSYVRKVAVSKGALQFEYGNVDGHIRKTSYVYDATKQVLVEK